MVVTEINAQQLVLLFVTVIAPLIVGLLTKASWSSTVKAVALAFLAAVIGVAQGFLAAPPDTTWSWQVALVNGLIAWIIAVATHFGFWKPVGASDVAQAALIRDDPPVEEELPAAA